MEYSKARNDLIARFGPTIGNQEWLSANEEKLKSFFSADWTPLDSIKALPLAFWLKCNGVGFRDEDEFGKVMTFITRLGIIEYKEPHLFRANPNRVFPTLN